MIIWRFSLISEGRNLPELFSELVLVCVEEGTLLPDVGHLVGEQRRHLLLHRNGVLLGVVPLLWKFLDTQNTGGN